MSKVVNGIMWSAIERLSVQGIQFLLTIIIARVLLPSDFGLIAMLGIFIAVAQSIVDSGFGRALIQKQDRTEIDFSTVFYFNLAISIFIYGILYLGAPYISDFYQEPRLTVITRIVGLNFIINSLSLVQLTKLTINLNFKFQAIASLLGVILSGVIGIIMAYNGFGVWSLVVQTISKNIITTVMLWIVNKWRPLLLFSFTSLKTLFSFGSKLLLTSIINTVYNNMYTLVIGKFYNARDVGLYNNSNLITGFASPNITAIINKVVYPELCKLNGDKDTAKTKYLKSLRTTCFITFPLCISICILAYPIIKVVFSEQWIQSVKYIQILSIAYLFSPLKAADILANSLGRPDLSLKSEVTKKIFAVCILIISIPLGIDVICYGFVASSIFDVVSIFYYVNKVVKITVSTIFVCLKPIIILNIILIILLLSITIIIDNYYYMLIISVLLGMTAYFFLAYRMRLSEIVIINKMIKQIVKI